MTDVVAVWFVSYYTISDVTSGDFSEIKIVISKPFFLSPQRAIRHLSFVSDANVSRGPSKITYLTSNIIFTKCHCFTWMPFVCFLFVGDWKGWTSLDGIQLSIFFHTTKSPLECPIFQQPGFTGVAHWSPQISIYPCGSTQNSFID